MFLTIGSGRAAHLLAENICKYVTVGKMERVADFLDAHGGICQEKGGCLYFCMLNIG